MTFRTLVIIFLAFLAYGCQEPGPPRGFDLPDGDIDQGRAAFEELKCHVCHEVSGLEDAFPRPVAQPLVDVKLGGLAMREPADGELVTSIINPSHAIYPAGEEWRMISGEESRMANYNEVITAQQLIDLVAFLHDRYETA